MGEKIYGLLGRKLGHSWSPVIHKALGCEDYRLIQLEPEELPAFLEREDIGGLNVTIPYKRDVMPLCSEIDPGAQAIGSVNTIVRRNGRLYGYNTDIDGFLYMLRRAQITLTDKKVLILGTGGASLTAQAAAQMEKAREILVISRSGPDNYENLDRHQDAQVLVNTTPVGMWPNVEGSPVDLLLFPALEAVADVIYNPCRTSLLLQAEALNRRRMLSEISEENWQLPLPSAPERALRWTGGLPMLAAQAVAAEERFFDRRFPSGETERILTLLRPASCNLVLVGMPGCGKSTVGRVLSEKTGLPLVDLDEEIARRAGCPIPDFFAREGEAAFRDLESRTLAEAMSKTGQIVSTGGGCVLRPENRLAMRRSGRVYFLQRDLDALPTDGRPLSQAGSLEEMYRVRLPSYNAAADASVFNNAPAEETAQEIWRDFCENSRD